MQDITPEYATYIVKEYSRSIIHLAFTYLKCMDDAYDVAQDVFISFLTTKNVFTDKNNEKAWLYRVTINRCLNIIKAPCRSKKVNLDDINYDKNSSIENLSYILPKENDVLLAMSELPKDQSTALYLHYIEGYSSKEISQILLKKKRAVDSILYRGLANLRNILKGKDNNE